MANKQYAWLDALKGFGIMCVVLGHTASPYGKLAKFIFSFHMPLFFFIAGTTFNYEKYKHSFPLFIQKKAKRLLVPYFTCGVIFFLVWLTFDCPKPFVNTPFSAIAGLFFKTSLDYIYGIGAINKVTYLAGITPIGPLWFLPCLFVTEVIFFYYNTMKSPVAKAFFWVAVPSAGYLIGKLIFLPFSIDISFIAVIFVWLGAFSRRAGSSQPFKLATVVVLFTTYVVLYMNSNLSMNNREYHNFILAILCAACATVILYMCFSMCDKFIFEDNLLVVAGKNSLTILCFHEFIKNYTFGSSWLFYSPLIMMAYLLLVCLIISFLLKRCVFLRSVFI
jgi:acyltransferase